MIYSCFTLHWILLTPISCLEQKWYKPCVLISIPFIEFRLMRSLMWSYMLYKVKQTNKNSNKLYCENRTFVINCNHFNQDQTDSKKKKTNIGKPTLIFSHKTHTKNQATQPVELVDPSIIQVTIMRWVIIYIDISYQPLTNRFAQSVLPRTRANIPQYGPSKLV